MQGLPSDAIAKIGDRIIWMADLEAEAANRQAEGLRPYSMEELLNRMMTQEALLLKAHVTGLENDPEIRRELDRVLITQLRERELKDRLDAVDVSDEEVGQAYAEQIQKFTKPAMNRFSMLFLSVDKKASEMKRAEVAARMIEAQRAARQLLLSDGYNAATGFENLPIEFSDDTTSHYRGGDLGWLSEAQGTMRLPMPVLQKALSLPVGQLSDVMETDQGLYLVIRTDTRPAVVTPLEQVQAGIHSRLLQDKRSKCETAYYDDCLRAANPQMNEALLATLKASMEKKDQAPDQLSLAQDFNR